MWKSRKFIENLLDPENLSKRSRKFIKTQKIYWANPWKHLFSLCFQPRKFSGNLLVKNSWVKTGLRNFRKSKLCSAQKSGRFFCSQALHWSWNLEPGTCNLELEPGTWKLADRKPDLGVGTGDAGKAVNPELETWKGGSWNLKFERPQCCTGCAGRNER